MELEFESRTTAFLRRSIEGVCRQEQTQEVIVPDASPDASRVIYCCAQTVVRSKECQNGAVILTGGVQIGALYLTDEDSQPRELGAYLPFTLRLEHPAARERSQVVFDCRVCSVDVRLVNSRKLLFRAEVGAQFFGFEPAEVELPLLRDTPKGLQLRCGTYPLPLPAEIAEKSFQLSDAPELTDGQAAAAELVAASVIPAISEQRLVGNKAVFKGTAQVKILYRSTDDGIRLFSQSFPFSQYCQLETDYDEERLQLLLAVTGCDVQFDPATPRRFAVRVDLLAQCLVTKTVTLTFCEDAYAVGAALRPERKELSFDCCLDQRLQQLALRESVPGEAMRGVIDSTLLLGFPSVEAGGRLVLPGSIRVLGYDADGVLCSAAGPIQVTDEIPLCRDASCLALVSQRPDGYASPASEGAEARYELTLDLCAATRQTFRTLSGGSIEADEASTMRHPSLIIRTLAESAPVWEVAKQYGTSMEAICSANALGGDEIEAGTLLLIPM